MPVACILAASLAYPATGIEEMANKVSTPKDRVYRGMNPAQRRAHRRQRIIEAALELYGTDGYGSTSILELCRSAGVATMQFYEEFPSSEDVLGAVHDEIVAMSMSEVSRALERSEDDSRSQTHACISAYCQFLLADPRRAKILCIETVGVSLKLEALRLKAIEQYADVLLSMYREVATENGCKVSEPEMAKVRYIAISICGGINQAIVSWFLDPTHPPIEDLIDALTDAMFAVVETSIERLQIDPDVQRRRNRMPKPSAHLAHPSPTLPATAPATGT